MKDLTFLLMVIKSMFGCLCLMLACSCEQDVTNSTVMNEIQHMSNGTGSAYIQCEMGPFYLRYDDLGTCATAFGFDSLMAEDWIQGCSMIELMVDSVSADIRVTYLEDGELEVSGLAGNLNAQPFELVVSDDTIDVSEYPFYGSRTYELDGLRYSFVMINRYIGGCFHDELIWEISE